MSGWVPGAETPTPDQGGPPPGAGAPTSGAGASPSGEGGPPSGAGGLPRGSRAVLSGPDAATFRPGEPLLAPGPALDGPGPPAFGPRPPPFGPDAPSGTGALRWPGSSAAAGASAASAAPGESTGVPGAVSDALWRGLGAKRPRGLAWPPRSFAGGDTIRLPVTFAVSGPGPFPWPHHVLPGPGACRRSACRGRDPAPP